MKTQNKFVKHFLIYAEGLNYPNVYGNGIMQSFSGGVSCIAAHLNIMDANTGGLRVGGGAHLCMSSDIVSQILKHTYKHKIRLPPNFMARTLGPYDLID